MTFNVYRKEMILQGNKNKVICTILFSMLLIVFLLLCVRIKISLKNLTILFNEYYATNNIFARIFSIIRFFFHFYDFESKAKKLAV